MRGEADAIESSSRSGRDREQQLKRAQLGSAAGSGHKRGAVMLGSSSKRTQSGSSSSAQRALELSGAGLLTAVGERGEIAE